ncbi:uncharacterized protein LOC110859148 [Folsomia candida]|uniref:uncharacterized protein LOC110859148 n=1 Tax=Folsomia candida TaxID=158441 RepID=UPI000B8F24B8|nr:uncharacterized protein LOC110859148 [Folsomia candida]XP_035715108.1 uncharacterized protein LOC110859148 [Folsomia candida]
MAGPAKSPFHPNFRLAEGEKLVQCPYDKSHWIIDSRAFTHYYKCKRNYVKRMKGLGLDPVVVGCRFDCGMQVLRPELENHEKICDLKPPYTDEEHLHDADTVSRARKLWAEERAEIDAETFKKPEKTAEEAKAARARVVRPYDENDYSDEDEEDWGREADAAGRPTFSLMPALY